MTVAIGIVVAVLLLAAIGVISMRVTERKPTSELRKQRPDASSIHGDGYSNT
jgi:hypothetical protein